MKNIFSRLTPRGWLVLLIIAAFLFWLFVIVPEKEKENGNTVFVPFPGADKTPTGGGGSSDVSIPGYLYSAESLPYTYTHKQFFTLVKNVNNYSDNYAGDRIEGGLRKLDANGRTYTAFYWINEIPYANPDGTPKDFVNVSLPSGLIVTIRKVYVQSNWVQTYTALRTQASEAWYQNAGADENRTYKTIMVSITT